MPTRGLVFDPIKTQEYPLNGRQSYMLLSLTPGVIFTQEQFGASGFSGTRGWDVNSSYKFNGARGGNGNNVFMMNGTAISDNGSQWEFAPSVDAIQEFSAMTTVYDAQYGHEAGGVVNTVIKGGNNAWHGTTFTITSATASWTPTTSATTTPAPRKATTSRTSSAAPSAVPSARIRTSSS